MDSSKNMSSEKEKMKESKMYTNEAQATDNCMSTAQSSKI